jgi:F-type H+-transporting ATPase subunit epsilon
LEDYFQLNIVTPAGVLFKDSVAHVQAPGLTGYFGIKPNHLPLITPLKIGKIIAESAKGRLMEFSTSGGYVEINKNVMTILAETAEKASNIDVSRAESARNRATKRLQSKKPDTDIDRARLALDKAMNRLKIASKI